MDRLDRDILKLAVPSILANITVPLVGMVDMAVAGHLSGSAATLIGGISIGAMLFDLLYWNFGFLRVGTGGLTAQAYGRGDRHYCAETLCRGVVFAWGIAFLMILLQWPFMKLVFAFVECSDPVRELASKYYMIRIWAAPATLSMMAFKGWFIGMQDTVSSMFTDLTVNAVNIVTSIVLSLGTGIPGFDGIGFEGIAWGTLIAQYSGLTFALSVVAFKYFRKVFAGIGLKQFEATFRGKELRKFVTMNSDLFLRSVGMLIVYIGFTVISARYGDLMLATGAILMKLLMLFSFFTDGFAYAGEALTGKFIGMQDREMTKRTVRQTFIWSMGIGIFFILIYFVGGTPIVRLLTSEAEVVDACRQFFVWLLPMPLIGCVTFTWDGIFVGATSSKALRDSSLWAVVGFYAVWFIFVNVFRPDPVGAIHILMLAYFAHLAVRALYLSINYRRSILVEPFDKL